MIWRDEVKKLPTDIWGLKYVPSLEPDLLDHMECHPEIKQWAHSGPEGPVSECNRTVLYEFVEKNKNNIKTILEIGTAGARNHLKYHSQRTTTYQILRAKTKDCLYLGIDEIKVNLKDDEHHKPYYVHNCYNIQSDSRNHHHVKKKMDQIGMKEVDLLVIDGDHSINMVVNDWQYTEWLASRGHVVFHDSNAHPGPVTVFDAVDEDLFEKTKYCNAIKEGPPCHGRCKSTIYHDWGIAVASRHV